MAATQVSRAELIARCLAERQALSDSQRLLVGIAGAPGAGKSTLSEAICSSLNDVCGSHQRAVVVPMDGFHLDNAILDKHGMRAVKGAPQTFDTRSFIDLLVRCRQAKNHAGGSIYYPVFDRHMDLARVAAGEIDQNVGILLIEGNYLLLKQPAWQPVHRLFHLTVMLDVPLATLEERLYQRWREHGLDDSAARSRALSNDIPNAETVLNESAEADLRLSSV